GGVARFPDAVVVEADVDAAVIGVDGHDVRRVPLTVAGPDRVDRAPHRPVERLHLVGRAAVAHPFVILHGNRLVAADAMHAPGEPEGPAMPLREDAVAFIIAHSVPRIDVAGDLSSRFVTGASGAMLHGEGESGCGSPS